MDNNNNNSNTRNTPTIIKGTNWSSVVATMLKVSGRPSNNTKENKEQELIANVQHKGGTSRAALLVQFGILQPNDLVWCWEMGLKPCWVNGSWQKKVGRIYLGVSITINGKMFAYDLTDEIKKEEFDIHVKELLLANQKEQLRLRKAELNDMSAFERALEAKSVQFEDEGDLNDSEEAPF